MGFFLTQLELLGSPGSKIPDSSLQAASARHRDTTWQPEDLAWFGFCTVGQVVAVAISAPEADYASWLFQPTFGPWKPCTLRCLGVLGMPMRLVVWDVLGTCIHQVLPSQGQRRAALHSNPPGVK